MNLEEFKDEIKNLIPGCYSSTDFLFCNHTLEMENASNILIRVLAYQDINGQKLGFNDYIQLHREFLESNNLLEEDINEQLESVKDLNRYFIND